MPRSYWRLKAIEAVNYSCQLCGTRKNYEDLVLHHVNPFQVMVVCKDCRKRVLGKRYVNRKAKLSVPRELCPRCGKPGIPRTHTIISYLKTKKVIYKYNAFEHPEENRWCHLGKYISKEERPIVKRQ